MSNKRILSPQETTQRIVSLESVYGQKEAARRLGISTDSLRRYRDGKRTAPENVYQKINRSYNRSKPKIEPEKVQARERNISRRQYGAVQGEVKKRTALIYPDYIAAAKKLKPLNEDARAKLERLHELGYVAAWTGGRDIPLEVQFIRHNEDPDRMGQKPKILALIDPYKSPKGGKPKQPKDGDKFFVKTLKPPKAVAKNAVRLKKSDDYLTRIRKVTHFASQDLKNKIDRSQSFDTILGFYFDENDEV